MPKNQTPIDGKKVRRKTSSADGRNDINDKGSHNKGGEHDQNDEDDDGEEPAGKARKRRKIKPGRESKNAAAKVFDGQESEDFDEFSNEIMGEN